MLPDISLPRPPFRVGAARGLAALTLLVLTASGCATKGDVRDLQTEIRDLTESQQVVVAELERQRRITADTLRTQRDQLVDFQGTVMQSLRRILTQLETLQELTGQNQRTIAQMRDQLVSLQQRVRGGGAVTGGPPLGGERPADQSAEEMYSAAMESFTRGTTRAAEVGFRTFIETYPRHELTPLAHFNLGDTYAQDGRYEDAIAEFAKIPERFPGSNRVPDALYRIGRIHLDELDQPDEGRRHLERVVNSYPESPAAQLARRLLEGSGGEDLR